jgi:hypothetical protein
MWNFLLQKREGERKEVSESITFERVLGRKKKEKTVKKFQLSFQDSFELELG